jgi:hypothetical protein
MAHSAKENTMLVLQQSFGDYGTAAHRHHARARSFMGLNAEGVPVAPVTATIADRVAAIRARMIAIGVPVAVGSGVVTMLAFAGAFGLARTERVWTPAIWLGAVATIGGLISVAVAAKATDDAAKTAALAPTSPAPTIAIAPASTAAPAAF